MYNPREDSFLLLKHIKYYIRSKDKVLDMGTGPGILAREAAKFAKQVIAADIDDKIIKELSEKRDNQKITYLHSNLFSNIEGKFDLIIFNPPYLPSKQIKQIDLDGGKNGTEIIERFLKQAYEHLNKDGKILLLCSSFNKDIEKLFKQYNYSYKKIDEQHLFFEKLYVYILE